MSSNFFSTNILARTLRPKEAAWSMSGFLRLKKLSYTTFSLMFYEHFPTKGQKISKANYGVFNSPKKGTKKIRPWLRIEDTINCF